MRRIAAVVSIALSAAACGGSSSSSKPASEPAGAAASASGAGDSAPATAPGQRPLEEDLPTLVTRAVEMFETVSDEIVASNGDCGAATGRLQALRGRYDAVITAARKVETDGRGAEIERLLQPHQTRIATAVNKMRPGVEACLPNPEFARAFEDLTGGGAK